MALLPSRIGNGRHSPSGLVTFLILLTGICIGTLLQSVMQSVAFMPATSLWHFFSSSTSHQSRHLLAGQKGFHRPSYLTSRATSLIGSQAPDFKVKAVVDQDFQEVSLSSYRGKYVVLFFYPLDFTFVCPTEIIAFSDRLAEFRDLNTEILGVSVDSEYAHLAWIQTPREEGGLGEIEYPLLSDLKKELATSYGVLGPDGAAYRGLFIIDKEGVVQHSTINNMAFGRNVDEVIRVLQAIQFVQENPDEVCPAGWQPGDKTMKPTFEGKKEYFSS